MSKTLSIVSWNVNGIRAAEKKGFLEWFHTSDYDIVCLQETKAHVGQLSPGLVHPEGYESYWSSAIRKGYSGTAIYTRVSPILAITTFGDPILDGEGRIVLLEFEKFFLFNVYFPNGGSGEERLAFKLEFYRRFLKLIEGYRQKKPIVVCGDVNTAHTEIDLARPKENAKVSGFMPIEREWVDKLVETGYIDTFRLFEKEGGHYTWWDMKSGARARNVGWRIDYFFVSNELEKNVKKAWTNPEKEGSDHCPVGLTLSF
ncbi:MAG: exodeoxyribonuclease III [Candidatus Magasanikbacteria bacterium]|nr:exodeoxyribonuclease III [Candidatus Magasanikbacteria bacterium]